MDEIEKLQEMIDSSNNIVFFGGAGVSTESGIPDFRSTDGLYSKEFDGHAPEDILSIDTFKSDPELFYKFYRKKILMQGQDLLIKPNAAHYKLAELEKAGKLKAIITQNIDTLHQDAGSKVVHQIHGTIATNHCVKCNKAFSLKDILNSSGVAKCDCGGIIKPDVVLYNEGLPRATWIAAEHAARNADMLIIAGTSLRVYPAADIINYYKGNRLVIINRDSIAQESQADLAIHGSIGEILSKIKVN